MENWHILVVEDDPDGQEVVGRILRHHHISHDTVASAEDAWDMIQQNTYTAAIIDLHLPGQDGWSLLQQIQADGNYSQMKCVAVTAYHSPELAYQAVEDGFVAYFPKPLEATSFVRELQNVL
jgi:CheY-like chemotaxis protein